MDLKIEWNGGMENGKEWWMYTTIRNSCNWCSSIKIELAAMCLGLLSHRRACRSKSSVAKIFPYLVYHDVMVR